MAGVMPTRRSSWAAMSHSHWPNTWVKVCLGGVVGFVQAHGGVELARAVVGHRVGLGQLVALAFFGDHMQKLRALAGA